MSESLRGEVTRLLRDIAAGNQVAKENLCNLVYDDLRRVAQALMRNERPGHTLQPTALVNEAMARLFDGKLFADSPNRALFFSAAAQAMRRILVDYARGRNAQKRAGQWRRAPLDDVVDAFENQDLDLEELDAAMEKLKILHNRQFQIVQLRFFGGLAVAEIADALAVSLSTVEKDLLRARTFLFREMTDG
jgi:RNA polymerase sigma factor (TIGR02999 family)